MGLLFHLLTYMLEIYWEFLLKFKKSRISFHSIDIYLIHCVLAVVWARSGGRWKRFRGWPGGDGRDWRSGFWMWIKVKFILFLQILSFSCNCFVLLKVNWSKKTLINDIQWSFTYLNTSVPKLTVCLTECLDKWITWKCELVSKHALG